MATKTAATSAFLKLEADQGYSRKDITLVAGQNLLAGTVLGKITASGKFTAFDNDATDGSQTAVAVLLADTNASSGDVKCVAIARHAIVAKQGLKFGAAVTTQAEKDAAYLELEAAGIVVRESV